MAGAAIIPADWLEGPKIQLERLIGSSLGVRRGHLSAVRRRRKTESPGPRPHGATGTPAGFEPRGPGGLLGLGGAPSCGAAGTPDWLVGRGVRGARSCGLVRTPDRGGAGWHQLRVYMLKNKKGYVGLELRACRIQLVGSNLVPEAGSRSPFFSCYSCSHVRRRPSRASFC